MVNIRIIRKWFKDSYTIGKIYVDEEYLSETLEDKERFGNWDSVSHKATSVDCSKKIYGKTAIPYGIYKARVRYSPKFKANLIGLIGVPCYEGILFHAGNTANDTDGCILVGQNKAVGMVLNSKKTLDLLMRHVNALSEITVSVEKG